MFNDKIATPHVELGDNVIVRLDAGEYLKQEVDNDGIIRSRIFPGLWLAVNSLLSGEIQQVLGVLPQGLDSPEHQEFIQNQAIAL